MVHTNVKYKVKFTEYQNNKFNVVDNEKIRVNLMSILCFMVKKNDEMNKRFLEHGQKEDAKEFYKMTISLAKLHETYKKKEQRRKSPYANISLTTFKERIAKLESLKLIHIEKSRGVNTYSFIQGVTKKMSTFSTCGKVGESIEIPYVDEFGQLHKYTNTKTKDLDSNNNTSNESEEKEHTAIDDSSDNILYAANEQCITPQEDYYNNYINQEEKVKDYQLVIDAAENLFKELKIRSRVVKSKVMDKLQLYWHTITIKHLRQYIRTAIVYAQQDMTIKYNNRKMQYQKPQLNFNNFEARNYDYTKLENALLYGENTTLSECMC